MNADARLKELGLELPEVPKLVAEHVPAKRVDELPASEWAYRRAVGERSLAAVRSQVKS